MELLSTCITGWLLTNGRALEIRRSSRFSGLRVRDDGFLFFTDSVYHPQKPLYQSSALLDYIETSVDELTTKFPASTIVLAGDFNALADAEVTLKTTLQSIVNRPTPGVNFLDRIYVNRPCYATVKVIISTVHSDHKAVVAYNGPPLQQQNKKRELRVFRRRSPLYIQHALVVPAARRHISNLYVELTKDGSVHTNVDTKYTTMRDLLDLFYPEGKSQ